VISRHVCSAFSHRRIKC